MDPTRRPSFSAVSGFSGEQPYSDGEGKEKQRCPHPDCGKTFKDLKAHMLTHQLERPEKCPIQTCDYHIKGFARKYDKNRHTLTHYKGTMVCGFCPGSGSAAEKSFNRADVFKRHLTAVHGVEQTPPNSRKKSGLNNGKKLIGYAPDATGKCSTCSQTFSNAQDFYEHLDDCVLNVIVPTTPKSAGGSNTASSVGPMSAGPASATTITTSVFSGSRKDSMRTPTTASTDKGERAKEPEAGAVAAPVKESEPTILRGDSEHEADETTPRPMQERSNQPQDTAPIVRTSNLEQRQGKEESRAEPEALEVRLGSPAPEDKMDMDP